VDLRTQTSLFCGALALAIAVSIVLRGGRRRPQLIFAAFAADIGLWYLAQWLYQWVQADVWARFTAVLAVLLPQFALHLFESLVPSSGRRRVLLQVAGIIGIPMSILALSPPHDHALVRGAIFFYVFGLLAAGLWALAVRGQRSDSRAVQRRVRLLVIIGALAVAFSLADFLWFIGAYLPPVGAALSIVFLFALSESMIRERLVDLYDILGQLFVSTALAFCLAGIFYVFVELLGGFETTYLGAILGAIVILVLFEPLREKVERYIHRAFFRERVDLERATTRARKQLGHVLKVEEMLHVVMSALEASRRATAAALYLRSPAGSDFQLSASFGPPAPAVLGGATARPLLERFSVSTSVVLEDVALEVAERRRSGQTRGAEASEQLLAAADLLGPYRTGVCLSVHGKDEDLVGVLIVVDDRVRDAFSPDEVSVLESLAVQIGVVVENTRQYRHMQERDRLAALGQLAAGLAHEVKNPLGAIKGAAQLLSEPADPSTADPATQEFVGIILEEVERLDRVVGSVLDYARPSKGDPSPVDVNAIIRRTLQVLAPARHSAVTVSTVLAEDVPMVRADAEQLRQVLMNLISNALQAVGDRGSLTITTRRREGRHPGWSGGPGKATTDWAEIAVTDDGPGIDPHVFETMFVPFVTTKNKGTGLGLAISQRMVEDMGGRIEATSSPGSGATFSVVVPSAAEDPGTARMSRTPSREQGEEGEAQWPVDRPVTGPRSWPDLESG
jgi:signal transduction histidine kinase